MGYSSGWGEPFKGPSMKSKVKYPDFGVTPESYADIGSSTFGQLSGPATTTTTPVKTGLSDPSFAPGPDIPGDKPNWQNTPYTWDTFGDPTAMLQLGLQGMLGKAGTINQKADLLGSQTRALEDIDWSSRIERRALIDALNQKQVWNSGIKERQVGEQAQRMLRYKGRVGDATVRGQRDLDLAKSGYDLQFDLGMGMEEKKAVEAHRKDIANRIKGMTQ